MTFFIATRIALHAIARNKLRSALTALGIIIGVGSLIALLGVGHGARAEVEKQVASLGENVIQVSAGSISKSAVKLGLGSSVSLTVEDADAIEEEIAAGMILLLHLERHPDVADFREPPAFRHDAN